MTTQELAQQILDIAQKALADELKEAIYISDVSSKGAARSGLESIIKLCRSLSPSQEAFKQYEKKVSHAKTS